MKFDINKHIFKRVITPLALFVVMFMPTIFKFLFINEDILSLITNLIYSIPLCFLLLLIRNRYIFILFFTIVMIISNIESIMVLQYQDYINAGNILSIIKTTIDESLGFFSTAKYVFIWCIPIIFLWLTGIFFNKYRSTKSFTISLIVSLISFFIYLIVDCNYIRGKELTIRFYVNKYLFSNPPYNIFLQTQNVLEYYAIRFNSKDAEKVTFNSYREDLNENKEIYVLAIGESVKYDNLSLGGYTRKTTPLLEQEDNLLLYSNYYSTATLTAYSIPQILTRATPHTFELSFKEPSILKPFQECDFRTYIICCKNLLNHEDYLTKGINRLYSVDNDAKISTIVDSISNLYPKTFFIVQYLGSHGPYDNFDDKCDIYHPNHVSDNREYTDRTAVKNSYDNTILYMDYNLSNLIKSINKPKTKSALLMISDHGEAFLPGTSGHGNSCNPNKEEYHVPLIFWYSSLWKDENTVKHRNLVKHKDYPINADNVFYSVLDMAGIIIAPNYAHEEWSIFSDSLELHDRLILVPDGKNYIEVK